MTGIDTPLYKFTKGGMHDEHMIATIARITPLIEDLFSEVVVKLCMLLLLSPEKD